MDVVVVVRVVEVNVVEIVLNSVNGTVVVVVVLEVRTELMVMISLTIEVVETLAVVSETWAIVVGWVSLNRFVMLDILETEIVVVVVA